MNRTIKINTNLINHGQCKSLLDGFPAHLKHNIVYTLRKKRATSLINNLHCKLRALWNKLFALPDVSFLIRYTSASTVWIHFGAGTFVWRRAMNCGKQLGVVCLIFIHLLEIGERVLLLMDRILSNYARNTLNIYLELLRFSFSKYQKI